MAHFHSKLWVKNAPVFGVNSDQEVLDYITSIVTCRIPDKDKEPELYDLVMKYQIHKCTSSCQRLVYNNNTKRKAIFPRPVQKQASLNNVKSVIKSRFGNKRVRLYNLATKNVTLMITIQLYCCYGDLIWTFSL